jgi:hypothetical protein
MKIKTGAVGAGSIELELWGGILEGTMKSKSRVGSGRLEPARVGSVQVG